MPEKRGTRRFNLQLPITVRLPENGGTEELHATTKDVSARGIYFFVDRKLEEGAKIKFTLTLPPEITLTESIRVRCVGRVVRVERAPSGARSGIASLIEQYEFLADA
jgi:hypothetical protein